MKAAAFDVAAWLARHPPNSCPTPPHVSQPVQLACWTKASGSTRYCDSSGLLPFVLPRLPASLDEGQYIPKEEDEDVGVERVIRAAASSAGASLAGCDVLTFRNNLNKIWGVPLDPSAAWTVDACLLPAPNSSGGSSPSGGDEASAAISNTAAGSSAADGSGGSGASGSGMLFLDIVKTEQAWSGDRADLERFTRWGYRFEALCTGQEVADASSEFGALLRTRIGPHRLIIGAEVDCFEPTMLRQGQQGQQAQQAQLEEMGPWQRQGQATEEQRQELQKAEQQQQQQQQPQQALPLLSSYIELKTYRLPQHPGQQRTLYRHKHPKWWLQSFLAGVPRLALGARDNQGMILRIDQVPTADLPRISAANGAGWSPNQALHFGSELLGWMREQAAGYPTQHLRFTYAAANSSGRTSSSSDGAIGGGGSGGRGSCRGWSSSEGSRRGDVAAGMVKCEVVAGGELPQRIRTCLAECGFRV